jgi:hypothetical protein
MKIILSNYPWPFRKMTQRRSGHESFWKRYHKEKPFLQGFVTVFEKKIPVCSSKEEKKRPFFQ